MPWSQRLASRATESASASAPPSATTSRGRLLATSLAVGGICSLVPVVLAAGGAFQIQVIAAGAGALMTTAGFTLAEAVWRRWRQSELWRLLGSVGFLLCCLGVVGMLAGVGIYH